MGVSAQLCELRLTLTHLRITQEGPCSREGGGGKRVGLARTVYIYMCDRMFKELPVMTPLLHNIML